MRTLVLDDPIVAVLDRPSAFHRNDRMGMHTWGDRRGGECFQPRIGSIHVVEGGGNGKRSSQHAGPAKLRDLDRRLDKRARQVDKFVSELDKVIAGHVTAPMWRCNEDHPLNERQRFDEQRAGQQIASLGIQFSLVKRDLANDAPEASATIDDGHLRQKPALAMADHDHLAKRRVVSLGVDVFAHCLQRLAQTHR